MLVDIVWSFEWPQVRKALYKCSQQKKTEQDGPAKELVVEPLMFVVSLEVLEHGAERLPAPKSHVSQCTVLSIAMDESLSLMIYFQFHGDKVVILCFQ